MINYRDPIDLSPRDYERYARALVGELAEDYERMTEFLEVEEIFTEETPQWERDETLEALGSYVDGIWQELEKYHRIQKIVKGY